MPGKFIVIDGPDGSGTTTHVRLLGERLTQEGFPAVTTAEPTSGSIGTCIRQALKSGKLSPMALQLLFCADRAEHLEETIGPGLQRNSVVISDRYVTSTIAYGTALGLDSAWLSEMNKKFIHPDCTIFLLPPLSVCKHRIGRRQERDSLEEDHLQERVYAAYEQLAKNDTKIVVIDSSNPPEQTSQSIWNACAKIF